MTAENRARNASQELARARQCLQEARVLGDASLFHGAVARATFDREGAAFHGARALLLASGIEARSHRAIPGLLGEHYVRAGKLSAAIARLVSRMQRDREDADYDPGAVFTNVEAREAIAQAESFLAEVEKLLA